MNTSDPWNVDILALAKDIHKGETAVLIGNGASLAKQKHFFAHAVQNDFKLFGNNRSLWEGSLFELDYFLMADPLLFREDRPTEDYIRKQVKMKKFFVAHCGKPRLSQEDLRRSGGISFTSRANAILPQVQPNQIPGSSIFITFQLILLMGFRTIYVVGCDCDTSHRYNHLVKKRPRDFTNLVSPWQYLLQYASVKYPSVKVYAIDPVGLKGIMIEDPEMSSYLGSL